MNYFVVKKSAKGHSWNLPLIKGGGVGEEGRTFEKLSHLGGGGGGPKIFAFLLLCSSIALILCMCVCVYVCVCV